MPTMFNISNHPENIHTIYTHSKHIQGTVPFPCSYIHRHTIVMFLIILHP